MLIRKEELIEKRLDVYLNGELVTGVEECDPQNGWVRVRMSRKPNSGLTPNLCIKRRGKVELRAKAPQPPKEIGVVKPKVDKPVVEISESKNKPYTPKKKDKEEDVADESASRRP